MYPLVGKVPNTHTLQPDRALAPVGDTSLDIMATAQAVLMGLVALACASMGAAKHMAMDYTSIERWVWERCRFRNTWRRVTPGRLTCLLEGSLHDRGIQSRTKVYGLLAW